MYNSMFYKVVHLVVHNFTTIEKEEVRPVVVSDVPKKKPGRKSKEKENLALVVSELTRNPNLQKLHFARVYGIPYATMRRWETEGKCKFVKAEKRKLPRI